MNYFFKSLSKRITALHDCIFKQVFTEPATNRVRPATVVKYALVAFTIDSQNFTPEMELHSTSDNAGLETSCDMAHQWNAMRWGGE